MNASKFPKTLGYVAVQSTNLIQLMYSGHRKPYVFETYLSSSYSYQQILFKISFHFKSVYQETGGLRVQCRKKIQAFSSRIKEWNVDPGVAQTQRNHDDFAFSPNSNFDSTALSRLKNVHAKM